MTQTSPNTALLLEVIEKTTNAIAILDAKATFTFCNDAMASILGESKAEVVGKTVNTLFVEDYNGDRLDPEELSQWLLGVVEHAGNVDSFVIDSLEEQFFKLNAVQLSTGEFLVCGKNITELNSLKSEIAHLTKEVEFITQTDPLTGVGNRRLFSEKLQQQIRLYDRYKESASVVLMGLDNFRNLNNDFGHEIADLVLANCAAMLTDKLRDTDLIARLSGDEFALILPNTNLEGAVFVAERERKLIERTSFAAIVGQEVDITASFGVAEVGVDGLTIEDILNSADSRLQRAKAEGKNRVNPECQ